MNTRVVSGLSMEKISDTPWNRFVHWFGSKPDSIFRLAACLIAPFTAIFVLIGHPPVTGMPKQEYLAVYLGVFIAVALFSFFMDKLFPRELSAMEIISTVFLIWIGMWLLGGQGDTLYRSVLSGDKESLRQTLWIIVGILAIQVTFRVAPALKTQTNT